MVAETRTPRIGTEEKALRKSTNSTTAGSQSARSSTHTTHSMMMPKPPGKPIVTTSTGRKAQLQTRRSTLETVETATQQAAAAAAVADLKREVRLQQMVEEREAVGSAEHDGRTEVEKDEIAEWNSMLAQSNEDYEQLEAHQRQVERRAAEEKMRRRESIDQQLAVLTKQTSSIKRKRKQMGMLSPVVAAKMCRKLIEEERQRRVQMIALLRESLAIEASPQHNAQNRKRSNNQVRRRGSHTLHKEVEEYGIRSEDVSFDDIGAEVSAIGKLIVVHGGPSEAATPQPEVEVVPTHSSSRVHPPLDAVSILEASVRKRKAREREATKLRRQREMEAMEKETQSRREREVEEGREKRLKRLLKLEELEARHQHQLAVQRFRERQWKRLHADLDILHGEKSILDEFAEKGREDEQMKRARESAALVSIHAVRGSHNTTIPTLPPINAQCRQSAT